LTFRGCIIIKNARKNLLRIVIAICIALLLAGLVYFGIYFSQKKDIEDFVSEMTVSSDTESDLKKPDKVKVPVNFKKLKKANPDTYAWITIPGLDVVNYPIVQSPDDNGYYLDHTVEGKKSVYGSIYTEDYNKTDFSDFNTVIYGHNMKNGTMFGSLKKFRGASFFKKNRYILVYQENRLLKYEIFAAYTWNNKHILATNDFDNIEDRTEYIEDIFAVRDMSSQFDNSIDVTAQDKIITLSTCMNNKEKRFIVSGVLVYDSQNP
jgi:sortase B